MKYDPLLRIVFLVGVLLIVFLGVFFYISNDPAFTVDPVHDEADRGSN